MGGRVGFVGPGVRRVFFSADPRAEYVMTQAMEFLKTQLKYTGVERSALVRFALDLLAAEVEAHRAHWEALRGSHYQKLIDDEDMAVFTAAWNSVLKPRQPPTLPTKEEQDYGARIARFSELVDQKVEAMLVEDFAEVERVQEELSRISVNRMADQSGGEEDRTTG